MFGLRSQYRSFSDAIGRLRGDIFSRAKQRLIEGEERLVDLIDIVVLVDDEVFDDQIEAVGVAECVARFFQQLPGLLQIQLQRDGKGNGRGLARLILALL